MKSFKDYLKYYNNLDTGPFCEALKNFIHIYKDQHIDIFEDYVTLPGVAMKMLYNSSKSNFALLNKQNADLYYLLKINIIGGPSIIFSRSPERNKTILKIKEENICQSIIGYDCNGLYSCYKQPMPTGLYLKRFAETILNLKYLKNVYIHLYGWIT